MLDPLGLDRHLLLRRRDHDPSLRVGHNLVDEDGSVTVATPWALPRAATLRPAASGDRPPTSSPGRASTSATAPRADGSRFLSEEPVARMQEPTADMRGSALGDAVGISWLLATSTARSRSATAARPTGSTPTS